MDSTPTGTEPAEPAESTEHHRVRTGRNLPAAIAVGAVLGGLVFLTLLTVKATFLLYMGIAVVIALAELTGAFAKRDIKIARHKAEEGRVAIRNIRRNTKDSLDKLIKSGEAGEDEVRRAERELDDLTHTYVGQVDELLKHKEAELLEV